MPGHIKYDRLPDNDGGMKWVCTSDHVSRIPYLGWFVLIPKDRESDGATWARDLGAEERGWRKLWSTVVSYFMDTPKDKITDAWFCHDEICLNGYVAINGTKVLVSNFSCSLCLSLLLWRDGYKMESFTWFFATFLFGGGKARKNGMFWVR